MTDSAPSNKWTSAVQAGPASPEMLPMEHILENGLRVITLSTPGFKTARVKVSINAGSNDDPKGQEGTAHFLEHMMLNGSFLNQNDHARDDKLSQWGGALNAKTSGAHTDYYLDEPVIAKHLDESVEMLLDIVQHPRLKSERINPERDVIKAEIVDSQNDIGEKATMHFLQTSFPGSPVSSYTLGTPESLDKIDTDTLRAFWNEHYSPHKTTISIQGPHSHDELLAMVKKHLTLMGAEDTQKPAPPFEWPELKARSVSMPVKGASGVECTIGWPGFREPLKPTDKEPLILDILCELVNKALHRELRDEGMIYSVDFDTYSNGHPMILEFSTDKAPTPVIKKVMKILSDLPTTITQDSLDRMLNEHKVDAIKQSDRPLDVALDKMEELEAGIPVYKSDAADKIYDSITLKEVHEMAARLFSKPCSYSVIGSNKLLKSVPKAEDIAAMYQGPRNTGSLQGWASPATEAAHDTREPSTEAPSRASSRTEHAAYSPRM